MKNRTISCAAVLAACAGLAAAQPTIDGVFNPGTEGSFYGSPIWVQTVGTTFGNNDAGDFIAGQDGGLTVLGDPENVTTGIEFAIPKSALGNPGATWRLFGIVNSGNRDFASNQMIHNGDLPVNTDNLGGTFFPLPPSYGSVGGQQFVSISSVPTGTPVIDGTRDASYTTRYFLQTNYTQFGNATQGQQDSAFGSEIDSVYITQDATNIYVMVCGNLEGNGNGLDLWFDTAAGGPSTLPGGWTTPSGTASIAAKLGNQAGVAFESGFTPNFFVSVDGTNGAGIRAYYAALSGTSILNAGDGQFSNNTVGGNLTAGDAGAPAIKVTIDNSNTIGVNGRRVGEVLPDEPDSPVAPNADWAYGSELNNVRTYLDEANNRLYVFMGGNMESNYNKLELFFDVQAGGQNPLRTDNVDISFNGLNRQGGLAFDADFVPDYWMNTNVGKTGDNAAPLQNFADAATLRTDGPLFDVFFGVLADWGAFSGGQLPATDVMNFPGTFADPADGRAALFTDGAPRTTTSTLGLPVANLINVSMNNNNVGGVGERGNANTSDPANVNTGIEFFIELDELGWDGVQDIKMAAFISSQGHDFYSNQFVGDVPANQDNLGDPANLDLTTLPGSQFLNLTNPGGDPCAAIDFTDDGVIDSGDLSAFITAFITQNLIADLTGDGQVDSGDLSAFITLFLQCV